ncbi:hypothetical protein L218DRAFT_408506 [Marasmius fiardii PR-910]|nr:hypothetical protein L218DRAFT_408506 [Marasmius fiardii PR-910]
MMMSCWNTDAQLRPTAKDVLARLESEVTERNEPARDWTDSVDVGKLRDHVKYPSVDVEAITEMLKNLGTGVNEERQQEPDNHKPSPGPEFSITSFYEECEQLKSRLLLLAGFDRYLSLIKPDSTKDVTTQLFDLFSLGTPLCHIFDLLPYNVVSRIGRLRVGSDDHSREEAISMFINGLEDIVEQVPGVEMLTVDDLRSRDSINGLRKVTKTVKALLDYRDQDAIRMRNLCAQELVLTDRKFVQDMEVFQQYASAVINANILEKDDALYLLLSYRPWEEQRWGEPFLQREYDFLVYASYSNYYQAATNSVRDNESKLSAFNHILNAKSEVPAFIIKPVSRICKYPLLLDSLVNYSSSHPHLDELKAAAEASKRTSDRINESMRESENLTTSQTLKTRVDDWKGVPIEQVGKLLRDDVFIVNVKNVDREYHVFLYERVLLCCRDAATLKSSSMRNGVVMNGVVVPKEYFPNNNSKKGKLVLKGRVYLQDVKQVASLPAHSESPGSRVYHPIAILWKNQGDDDDNDSVDCVKLLCRSDDQAREWEKSLGAAITAVRLQGTTTTKGLLPLGQRDGFSKNVESSLVKVKVYLPSGQNIRLRFPEDSTRQELVDGIFKKVRGLDDRFVDSESLRIKYEDEDGDYVSLTTDEDVQMAFADGAAVLRIQGVMTSSSWHGICASLLGCLLSSYARIDPGVAGDR